MWHDRIGPDQTTRRLNRTYTKKVALAAVRACGVFYALELLLSPYQAYEVLEGLSSADGRRWDGGRTGFGWVPRRVGRGMEVQVQVNLIRNRGLSSRQSYFYSTTAGCW